MTELHTVTLHRQYPIGAHKLYELLSTPRYMQQWFSPSPDITLNVEAQDFIVGGKYRFSYTLPDGQISIVTGEYCAITPPNTLAFTWGWEEPDEHAGLQTLVTITLSETNGETTLTVSHEQLHEGIMLDRHSVGWEGTLAHLETLVNTLEAIK